MGHGGRPIRYTGHKVSDELRRQIRTLGITMTELAKELGVDKSDISHALSPRCAKKRYRKLRSRIRKTLARLFKQYVRWTSADRFFHIINIWQKRMPKTYELLKNKLCHLASYLADAMIPLPNTTLASFAITVHPSTLHKAIHNHPKSSEKMKEWGRKVLDGFVRIMAMEAY